MAWTGSQGRRSLVRPGGPEPTNRYRSFGLSKRPAGILPPAHGDREIGPSVPTIDRWRNAHGDPAPRAPAVLVPVPRAVDALGDGQCHRGIEHDDGSSYALMGLAVPSGASGSGAAPPAARDARCANEVTGVEVGALLQAIGVPSGGTGSSPRSALLGPSNLDPVAELGRLSAGLSGDAVSLRELGG